MTFFNNTKLLLTTLLCNFDNFLVNYYFDLNYLKDYNIECKTEFDNGLNNEFNNEFNNKFNNKFTSFINILNSKINYNYLDYKSVINYYPNYYNLLLCTLTIIFGDFLLIILFGYKGRWFQLHAFTNLLIVL